tara:strand:- start:2120 stop:3166 length:1047 start_codon:yes stop_codon:yes gene_type:complete
MENKRSKPALPAGRYFKYAIGEIVLVVIGILIALQVNNWNEKQAQDDKTIAIFNQIIDEMIIDVRVIQNANEFFIYKDSLIDVYRKTDLKSIPKSSDSVLSEDHLVDLIRTFAPIELHDRGFNLLTDHIDQVDKKYEKYVDELVYLYQDKKPLIDLYYDRLKTILYEHRMYKIKNFAWYSRMNKTNKRDQEEYEYYKFNPIYKNYVRFYNDMIYNLAINLRNFEDLTIKFSRQLNYDFKLGRDIDKELGFKNPSKELLQSISGNYLIRDKDTLSFIEKNGQLYESTLDNQQIVYVFERMIKVGELRYLGDSIFYRNYKENLKVNKDGSLTVFSFTNTREDKLKLLNND